jgi:cytochrome c oxidase subunit III
MSAHRGWIDVSHLPDTAFGPKVSTWWGTASFIVIEGMTIAICLASYFYLWRNSGSWPPPRTPPPDLLFATINLLLVLASAIPAVMLQRTAERMDEGATRRLLLVSTLVGTAVLVLYALQLTGLHTRWDEHAYGSIVWMTLGFHAAVVLTDVADTYVLTAIFLARRVTNKDMMGANDGAMYWLFVVASFVVVYAVIFIGPRVM